MQCTYLLAFITFHAINSTLIINYLLNEMFCSSLIGLLHDYMSLLYKTEGIIMINVHAIKNMIGCFDTSKDYWRFYLLYPLTKAFQALVPKGSI